MSMMDKKRLKYQSNYEKIRNPLFVYYSIFASLGKGIRKNEPLGKSEYFFPREIRREIGLGLRIPYITGTGKRYR